MAKYTIIFTQWNHNEGIKRNELSHIKDKNNLRYILLKDRRQFEKNTSSVEFYQCDTWKGKAKYRKDKLLPRVLGKGSGDAYVEYIIWVLTIHNGHLPHYTCKNLLGVQQRE